MNLKEEKEKLEHESVVSVVKFIDDFTKTPTQYMSDGYHTFDELYRHRYALLAVLCKQLYLQDNCYKSKKHEDGTMYEGWFIVVVNLTCVGQISYHVPQKYWDNFNIREEERSKDFDGHTSQNVIKRLWDYAVS